MIPVRDGLGTGRWAFGAGISLFRSRGPVTRSAKGRFWFLRTIEALYDEESAYRSYLYSLTTLLGRPERSILEGGPASLEQTASTPGSPTWPLRPRRPSGFAELEENETPADAPEAVDLLRAFLARRKKAIADRGMNALREADARYRPALLQLLESAGFEEAAAFWSRSETTSTGSLERRTTGRAVVWRPVARGRGRRRRRRLPPSMPLRGPLAPAANPAESAAARGGAAEAPGFGSRPSRSARLLSAHGGDVPRSGGSTGGNWVTLRPEFACGGWEPYADQWFADPAEGVCLGPLRGFPCSACVR